MSKDEAPAGRTAETASTAGGAAETASTASGAAETASTAGGAAETASGASGAAETANAAAVAANAASSVRRGVISLARRLRLERSSASRTGLELGVLGHLHRRGALTPGDLAALERVQPQSLTRTLAELERTDLVSRQPDAADGRRSLLVITDSGLTALRAEMAERDAWLAAAMTASLTSTEIELLRLAGPLLEHLADAQTMIT